MSSLNTTLNHERDFGQMMAAQFAAGHFVCVGLDPVYEKIPLSVPGRHEDADVSRLEQALAYYGFCVQIVDATKDVAAAYKPNTAFFEAAGYEGYMMLEQLIRHIRRVAPGVPVIVDAKRGDIGKTNVGSVHFLFDVLQADAVTVNPYFGEEALSPFLDRAGKGVIVLCRTSNPGAEEFQSRLVVATDEEVAEYGFKSGGHVPLYQLVAQRSSKWQTAGTIAVVVGATAPDEMSAVRQILPTTIALLPGLGAQGGDTLRAVLAAMTAAHDGFVVNAGSQVLYASDEPQFATVSRSYVIEMNRQVTSILAA